MSDILEAINPNGYAQPLKVDSGGHLIISGGSGGGAGGATEAKQDTMLTNQGQMKTSLQNIDAGIGNGKVEIQGTFSSGVEDFTGTDLSGKKCLDVNVVNTDTADEVKANLAALHAGTGQTLLTGTLIGSDQCLDVNNPFITNGNGVINAGGTLQQVLIYGKKDDGTLQPLECLGDRLLVDVVELAASGKISTSTALSAVQVCGFDDATSQFKTLNVDGNGDLQVSDQLGRFGMTTGIDASTSLSGSLTETKQVINCGVDNPTASTKITPMKVSVDGRLEVDVEGGITQIAPTIVNADTGVIQRVSLGLHDVGNSQVRTAKCDGDGNLFSYVLNNNIVPNVSAQVGISAAPLGSDYQGVMIGGFDDPTNPAVFNTCKVNTAGNLQVDIVSGGGGGGGGMTETITQNLSFCANSTTLAKQSSLTEIDLGTDNVEKIVLTLQTNETNTQLTPFANLVDKVKVRGRHNGTAVGTSTFALDAKYNWEFGLCGNVMRWLGTITIYKPLRYITLANSNPTPFVTLNQTLNDFVINEALYMKVVLT